MIKKTVRLQRRNELFRADRARCLLLPRFISLIAITALSICRGRCAPAVDETRRRAAGHSDDRPTWDKLLSNVGRVRKAGIKESPPIFTDGLLHTSRDVIVTIYGVDGNLCYTPCGIRPDTNGCRSESVRSGGDWHADGCGRLLDLCLSHRDNHSFDPLDFLAGRARHSAGPHYRAGLVPGQ
jgi:hypothetical protein